MWLILSSFSFTCCIVGGQRGRGRGGIGRGRGMPNKNKKQKGKNWGRGRGRGGEQGGGDGVRISHFPLDHHRYDLRTLLFTVFIGLIAGI